MARSSRPLGDRRAAVGYTQEGLAEALGVDRTTIGRWERGQHRPQPWQRPDLAAKLGITLDQLDSLLRSADTARIDHAPESSQPWVEVGGWVSQSMMPSSG